MKLRRRKVDRTAWPMNYVGRKSQCGLEPGTPCRIERTWAGGFIIHTTHGGKFTVARNEVRRP